MRLHEPEWHLKSHSTRDTGTVCPEYKGRRVSLDSDEQDMRRLLGDSFSLSESSLQNAARKTSPQPVKKVLTQLKGQGPH